MALGNNNINNDGGERKPETKWCYVYAPGPFHFTGARGPFVAVPPAFLVRFYIETFECVIEVVQTLRT